jgi:hypothetical protein
MAPHARAAGVDSLNVVAAAAIACHALTSPPIPIPPPSAPSSSSVPPPPTLDGLGESLGHT